MHVGDEEQEKGRTREKLNTQKDVEQGLRFEFSL